MNKLDISIESYKVKLAKLTTSSLWDRSYGNAIIIDKLNNYSPNKILMGPIFIVNVKNNILPIIQAINSIPEGYVLVINNILDGKDALIGDIIMTAAQAQNIGGIVVLGNIRDLSSIPNMSIPIWAKGININAAKLGESCESFPNYINIDDKIINNEDWIIGDNDGLIVVKKEKLRLIIKMAEVKIRNENQYIKSLVSGERIYDLMNVDNFLNGRGNIIINF
jgi:4-hydroxy-4-methyl-2-oxoglutarate aldolase